MSFKVIKTDSGLIKAWTGELEIEKGAETQLKRISELPFIYKHVAVMPDVHAGLGATIGSVIPTVGAIIPAAVGVDIGCGMMAVRTSLTASDLPDNLDDLYTAIAKVVPHGRTNDGGKYDRGAWGDLPTDVEIAWMGIEGRFKKICEKHPKVTKSNNSRHLGTMGTGNHFLEICLDEEQRVWVMLHSGSRGVGAKLGSYFIDLAKQDMRRYFINLPDTNLAYLPEGTDHFVDYIEAVEWAQNYAKVNRELMMDATLRAMKKTLKKKFEHGDVAVNCHHNYVSRENHFKKNVFVTRKGAVRARKGDLGIIPGSMGARSFIVRGKGDKESFTSCSHGAGRVMSRTEARSRFTKHDLADATEGVTCRKDSDVVDEIPMAYKDLDLVMSAQSDLVEIVHTLKQVLCLKG